MRDSYFPRYQALQDSGVADDTNINNKLIAETVNDYPYESKNESYNVNVAQIEPTHPLVNDWDCKPTEEEW